MKIFKNILISNTSPVISRMPGQKKPKQKLTLKFFPYLFSPVKVLMDQKESRIASPWVFLYCIHSQWQSGAFVWSHRDWQMVTTSWQEKQRESQEKSLTSLDFSSSRITPSTEDHLSDLWMFTALLHHPSTVAGTTRALLSIPRASSAMCTALPGQLCYTML